jgi:hypothetical protein
VTAAGDRVGPVLEAGDDADAVIAAIRELNDEVVVEDRGSYLRVLVPSRCAVSREAIERARGRAFKLPDELEQIMVSFKGAFAVSEDAATWEARRP